MRTLGTGTSVGSALAVLMAYEDIPRASSSPPGAFDAIRDGGAAPDGCFRSLNFHTHRGSGALLPYLGRFVLRSVHAEVHPLFLAKTIAYRRVGDASDTCSSSRKMRRRTPGYGEHAMIERWIRRERRPAAVSVALADCGRLAAMVPRHRTTATYDDCR